MFDDYIVTSEKIGIRRKREQIAFGLALQKLIPGLRREKRTDSVDDAHGTRIARVWCYLLPSLSEARESFQHAVGQRVTWPVEPAEDSGGETDGTDVVRF